MPLTTAPRLLFYVQHLLGIGHIKRAALLARSWCEAGFDVVIASGGEAVAGIAFGRARLHQLPPLRAADSQFSGLVDGRGQAPDEAFKGRRRDQLLALLAQERPDILVLESYPFGRRQLRWELLPLLQAAAAQRPRPLILSSLRDILQQRRPEREAESLALTARYFDHLLVHGDAAFIPLEQSCPAIQPQSDKLIYTGYVTDSGLPPYQPGATGEVLVSAGGGAVGYPLMAAALAARPLSPLAAHRWRFLLGPNLSAEECRQLRRQAGEGVIMEPVRPDFPALLSRATLSISQGGYNTLMDLLGVGCPMLLVPFEGDGETEQLTRCERLQRAGIGTLVRERDLSANALASAITRASVQSTPSLSLLRDGAATSARQLWALWRARQRGEGAHAER